MMRYKGYTGTVEFDDEAGILFGHVDNLTDVITFHGTSVDEVRQAFRDSVDDYLAFCAQLGEPPEKPYSGRLPFRTTPERHRRIARAARAAGLSINAWMDKELAAAAETALAAGTARRAPSTVAG